MLVVELNEFNPELLGAAASRFGLAHIARMLALAHTRTIADCTDERHGLDPWVQWVSFHTGEPAARHGVRHLGDVRNLRLPQFWEEFSARTGGRVGLWGVMNASAGAQAGKVDFFFPDPWTFSEQALPAELDRFLRLPRYYAKNYLKLEPRRLLGGALSLLRFLLRPERVSALLPHTGALLRALWHGGLRTTTLFGGFDLVNAALFARFKRRHGPALSLIFLNSIAHLQHHGWTLRDGFSADMETVMRLLDRTLGLLFAASDGEELLVLNAFRQVQCFDEGAFLYRQIDPAAFLLAAGIRTERIEQLMTNDAHLFFADESACRAAGGMLAGAHIDGQCIFDVEVSAGDPCQLFCQIDFWNDIAPGAVLHIGDRELDFYRWFERVVQRSGKHVAEGDAFARGIALPAEAPLHAITAHIRESLWGRQPSMS